MLQGDSEGSQPGSGLEDEAASCKGADTALRAQGLVSMPASEWPGEHQLKLHCVQQSLWMPALTSAMAEGASVIRVAVHT